MSKPSIPPIQLPVAVDHKVKNLLEAMTNLLYLARLEADDPAKVRKYMDMADDCMKKTVECLYPRQTS